VFFGKGYIGLGLYISSLGVSRKKTPEYQAWKDMLKRCYSEKSLAESPRYTECTVSDEWLNFQNYASWYANQPSYGKGWHVDKDLLVDGNKIYSPTNCCMLPGPINTALNVKPMTEDKVLPQGIQSVNNGKYAVRVRGLKNGSYVGTYTDLEEAISVQNKHKKIRIQELIEEYKYQLDDAVKKALTERY
jgi:hypothetical protein